MDKGQALISSDAAELDKEKYMHSKRLFETPKLDNMTALQALICVKDDSTVRDAEPSTTSALDRIMEALTCGDNNIIGVLVPESPKSASILEKVSRRVERDGLFDVVVAASVSREPNNRRIQDEIAEALGLKFEDETDVANRVKRPHIRIWPNISKALGFKFDNERDMAKRAKRLRERIQMKQKILVILRDLGKGLDLDKVGIPYGADHTGCKLLLTSTSEEVLSEEMHCQKVVEV